MDDYNSGIKLYQQRDFSEKLNATFSFLRQNAGAYFKAQLYISGPVAIVVTVLYTLLFRTVFSEISQATTEPGYTFSWSYFVNVFSSVLVNILLVIAVTLVNYCYMKLYHERNREKVDTHSVFQELMRYVPRTIVLFLIWGFVIAAGFMVFILPGIYLAVVATLSIPILVNENVGIGEAFSRPFRLIQGKWFSTFGLVIVTAVIGYIVTLLISLPGMILFGIDTFLGLDGAEMDPAEAFSPWAIGVYMLFNYVGSIVSNSIIQAAIGFQYYNLVEMKESRGLLSEIDKVGKKPDEDSANEGQY